MQFKEIYDKTRSAFERNEVYELLMGYKEYTLQESWVPINIPTHVDDIFRMGIYPFYFNSDETYRSYIVSSTISAMRRIMVSEIPIERWWALAICYGMKLSEERNHTATFCIANQLLSEIPQYLLEVKNSLIEEKLYGGSSYPNGLWGDVERYNRLLLKYFNMKVIGDCQ